MRFWYGLSEPRDEVGLGALEVEGVVEVVQGSHAEKSFFADDCLHGDDEQVGNTVVVRMRGSMSSRSMATSLPSAFCQT